jgi:hypothetical protein
MISFLNNLVEGWKELRNTQGYSYQVSRSGKRRVVPVDDFGRRGEIDGHWIATGEFAEDRLRKTFNRYHFKESVSQMVRDSRLMRASFN